MDKIVVRALANDRFEIQPVIPGAFVPARLVHRADLSESMLVALVILSLSETDEPIEDVGKKISEDEWEIYEAAFLGSQTSDDA